MRQRTVLEIAKLAESCFSYNTLLKGESTHFERTDWFADFLFEHEFGASVLRYARAQSPQAGVIKNVIVGMWENPDSLWLGAPGSSPAQQRLQAFVVLAAALLERSERPRSETLIEPRRDRVASTIAALELDGYRWAQSRLTRLEANAFDVSEADDVITFLYAASNIGDVTRVRKEIKDIDDHYLAGKWGDAIKHARDLLEMTLLDVAVAWLATKSDVLTATAKTRPAEVREALKRAKFFDEKEFDFVRALYALLSDQGGHPNMSERENARICRQYALSALQFLLLRYGKLTAVP